MIIYRKKDKDSHDISDSRINQQLIHTHDDPEQVAWASYSIIRFFRNLAVLGGASKRKLVLDAVATEPELQFGMVREIESTIRIGLPDGSRALLVRGWIRELWPDLYT